MPKRRSKVLILDGDRESCLALHRALFDGRAAYDVLLATSTATARELMREVGVDVLIIDVDMMPGTAGVDLISWAGIEFPDMLYVVQTSHDVEELQRRIAGLGSLRLLKKPCAPKDVLKIVQETLDSVHRLSGCFSTLSAADLIQMFCLTQRSAALRISAGGISGAVMVKQGQLVHAAWGMHVGQSALCEILAAEDGVFRTTPLPDNIEPSIHLSWQQALMEAVRVLDERGRSPRRTGSFPAIRIDDLSLDHPNQGDAPRETSPKEITVDARRTPRSEGVASSLVDRGFAALRAGNVEEARQFWLAAKKLDPENRSLDLNLKKLDGRATK
jgi:DNA-binding response OmpR family regulator